MSVSVRSKRPVMSSSVALIEAQNCAKRPTMAISVASD